MRVDFEKISKAEINKDNGTLNEIEKAFYRCLTYTKNFIGELNEMLESLDNERKGYNESALLFTTEG
jgi:hypothetical protein